MRANSTGREKPFLSASEVAVSQEVADGKISIQSACTLNTRYNYIYLARSLCVRMAYTYIKRIK
jgi:hypothetical protein